MNGGGSHQAGDTAGARQVVEDMRAAGAPPNAVTYTVIMDSMVAAGNLKVFLLGAPASRHAPQSSQQAREEKQANTNRQPAGSPVMSSAYLPGLPTSAKQVSRGSSLSCVTAGAGGEGAAGPDAGGGAGPHARHLQHAAARLRCQGPRRPPGNTSASPSSSSTMLGDV